MMPAVVKFRNFWGEGKRAELLASLDDSVTTDAQYVTVEPDAQNRFAFRPGGAEQDIYATWCSVQEFCSAQPISGLDEKRRGRLLASRKNELEQRMRRYLDPETPWEAIVRENAGPTEPAGRFDPLAARRRILAAGAAGRPVIRRYALHPFDEMWCAWTAIRPIWNEPRADLVRHLDGANPAFITRMAGERPHENIPVFMTRHLPDGHLLRPHVVAIPVMLLPDAAPGVSDLLSAVPASPPRANLSPAARAYLASLGSTNVDADPSEAAIIWHHALATCVAPAYIATHGASIRQGWPRIPLPESAEALRASAALGAHLAALLDPDTPVPGVTAGTPRPELAAIAVPATVPGAAGRDWRLTADWGNRSDKGITMPRRGRADLRDYAAPAEAATAAQAALLGARTLDVWMNGASLWRNIPERVWEVHIGGYQVLKKWLSYRDHSILDRPLTEAEVAHVQATARRLAALLLLGPALDESFHACAAAHAALPKSLASAETS